LKFSFPYFQLAALRGVQMGERPAAGGRMGANMPRKPRSYPKTKQQAIKLRKDLTPAERKLWSKIRDDQLGVTFRRQHAVGKYIPDFCAPKKKLIIELDGSQHIEQEQYDEARTKYLEDQGYKVIRFWNNQVMNDIEDVIRAIMFAMETDTHSPEES
jgi:very-short-patch-repair endonuclease